MAFLKRKAPRDPNSIVPTTFSFLDAQVDGNGYFNVDLGFRRMLLGRSTEVCLSELHTDMLNIPNIKSGTRYVNTIQYTGSNPPAIASGDQSRRVRPFKDRGDSVFQPNYQVEASYEASQRETTTHLPECKVATLAELYHVLSYVLDHLHIRFDVENKKCSLIFEAACDEESIDFDLRVARVLGLVKQDGTTPILLETMYNSDIQWSTFGSGDDTRIRLTRRHSKSRFVMILPNGSKYPAWNFISNTSSQSLFVSTDLVTTQFTGTKLTNTLAIFPIDPLRSKLAYEPDSADWKKVNSQRSNTFKLFFQDSTGKPFSNLRLSFVLQFRAPPRV